LIPQGCSLLTPPLPKQLAIRHTWKQSDGVLLAKHNSETPSNCELCSACGSRERVYDDEWWAHRHAGARRKRLPGDPRIQARLKPECNRRRVAHRRYVRGSASHQPRASHWHGRPGDKSWFCEYTGKMLRDVPPLHQAAIRCNLDGLAYTLYQLISPMEDVRREQHC
jgi:hypothetical protein